jgi:hypothetical protein
MKRSVGDAWIARGVWSCDAPDCTYVAGELRIEDGPDGVAELVTFSFTGSVVRSSDGGGLDILALLLAADDLARVHELYPDWTSPFYYPDCGKSYCNDHWAESAADYHVGACPSGHSPASRLRLTDVLAPT